MAKVLEKTFDIIELLSSEPQREFSVSEVAALSKVNKATAGRILMNLTERGYACQMNFRGGYSLGPMAYSLAAKGLFRKDLIDAAKEPASRLAHETLRESVIVPCLHGGRRYILVNENGNREVQPVIDKPWYDDLYYTATGRLLLANASDRDISSYIARHSMPGALWDGVSDGEALRLKLAEIKDAPYLSFRSPTVSCLWIMAFPIRRAGRIDAALGITVVAESFVPPRSEELLRRGVECARQIEMKLAAPWDGAAS